jgi:hypothetical protein
MGVDPFREKMLSREWVRIFASFWEALELDGKGKTTQRRYSNGLQALGGYLLKNAVSEKGKPKPARRLLLDAIDTDDGPLIFHDEESWQRELDSVCRKLYKHLMAAK